MEYGIRQEEISAAISLIKRTNNSIFDDEFERVFPRPDTDLDDVPEEAYEEKEEKAGCYL